MMNIDDQFAQLQNELVEKTNKQNELNAWLLSHFNSDERTNIISEINALSVSIKTIKYKLNNIAKGEPLLGNSMGDIVIQDNNPKTNKQQ